MTAILIQRCIQISLLDMVEISLGEVGGMTMETQADLLDLSHGKSETGIQCLAYSVWRKEMVV